MLGQQSSSYPFLDPGSTLLDDNLHERFDSLLTSQQTSLLTPPLVAQYLALSSSNHLLNGWRLLSQATAALLAGARSASVHMAYYAELRAAKAILATSGIVIRDNVHCVLDASGNVTSFGALRTKAIAAQDPSRAMLVRDLLLTFMPFRRTSAPNSAFSARPIKTHVAAWAALTAWAKLPNSGLRIINSLAGLRFSKIDWVESCCQSAAMRESLAGHWAQNWSIDLKSIAIDQGTRNKASYGVDLSQNAFAPLSAEDLRLIMLIHKSWLGIDQGSVDELDLCLINDFVNKSAKYSGWAGKEGRKRMWQHVQHWLEGPGGQSPAASIQLVDAVRKTARGPASRILKAANGDKASVTGILCRSFLLLRLASALLSREWQEMAIISPHGVLSWQQRLLNDFAVNSHLDSKPSSGVKFADFEIDISDVLDELDRWMAVNTPFDPCRAWKEVGHLLREICRFERNFLARTA